MTRLRVESTHSSEKVKDEDLLHVWDTCEFLEDFINMINLAKSEVLARREPKMTNMELLQQFDEAVKEGENSKANKINHSHQDPTKERFLFTKKAHDELNRLLNENEVLIDRDPELKKKKAKLDLLMAPLADQSKDSGSSNVSNVSASNTKSPENSLHDLYIEEYFDDLRMQIDPLPLPELDIQPEDFLKNIELDDDQDPSTILGTDNSHEYVLNDVLLSSANSVFNTMPHIITQPNHPVKAGSHSGNSSQGIKPNKTFSTFSDNDLAHDSIAELSDICLPYDLISTARLQKSLPSENCSRTVKPNISISAPASSVVKCAEIGASYSPSEVQYPGARKQELSGVVNGADLRRINAERVGKNELTAQQETDLKASVARIVTHFESAGKTMANTDVGKDEAGRVSPSGYSSGYNSGPISRSSSASPEHNKCTIDLATSIFVNPNEVFKCATLPAKKSSVDASNLEMNARSQGAANPQPDARNSSWAAEAYNRRRASAITVQQTSLPSTSTASPTITTRIVSANTRKVSLKISKPEPVPKVENNQRKRKFSDVSGAISIGKSQNKTPRLTTPTTSDCMPPPPRPYRSALPVGERTESGVLVHFGRSRVNKVSVPAAISPAPSILKITKPSSIENPRLTADMYSGINSFSFTKQETNSLQPLAPHNSNISTFNNIAAYSKTCPLPNSTPNASPLSTLPANYFNRNRSSNNMYPNENMNSRSNSTGRKRGRKPKNADNTITSNASGQNSVPNVLNPNNLEFNTVIQRVSVPKVSTPRNTTPRITVQRPKNSIASEKTPAQRVKSKAVVGPAVPASAARPPAKRRRPATMDPAKREAHNLSERRRRKELTDAFEKVRQRLILLLPPQKFPKVQVLYHSARVVKQKQLQYLQLLARKNSPGVSYVKLKACIAEKLVHAKHSQRLLLAYPLKQKKKREIRNQSTHQKRAKISRKLAKRNNKTVNKKTKSRRKRRIVRIL